MSAGLDTIESETAGYVRASGVVVRAGGARRELQLCCVGRGAAASRRSPSALHRAPRRARARARARRGDGGPRGLRRRGPAGGGRRGAEAALPHGRGRVGF